METWNPKNLISEDEVKKLKWHPYRLLPSGKMDAHIDTKSRSRSKIFSWTLNLLVARGGIEPPTHGFSVRCSTNWAIWPFEARFLQYNLILYDGGKEGPGAVGESWTPTRFLSHDSESCMSTNSITTAYWYYWVFFNIIRNLIPNIPCWFRTIFYNFQQKNPPKYDFW